MRWLMIAAVALAVAACASIGRPEGGPRDEKAPEFVRSTPMPGEVNVDRGRIDIFFNENIKLEDASNKIVVSPAQAQSPAISSNGRRLSVEFRDSIVPDATYTIDFSDAIRDLNEGNILDNFAIDFSTGPTIDSLRISGMVFEARTLEPAQGMVVGVYSDLSDTALTTMPMERVAKTNQYGQFTIRGLKPGEYRIFAIDDRNHDWRWDRSENVAFYPLTISPSAQTVELTDTLLSSLRTDSVATRQATQFLPDDILLTWFNENYRTQYLRDYKRPVRRQLTFLFGAPRAEAPEFTVANGPLAGLSLDEPEMAVLETRPERDSLVYWLRHPSLVAQDSLFIAARYQKTDSAGDLAWQTDTLKMFFRDPKPKKKEKNDTLPPEPVFLTLRNLSQNPQELNHPLRLEASEPLDSIPAGALRLEMASDTLWVAADTGAAIPDSLSRRFWTIPVQWQEGARYRLTADSLSVVNIYGEGIKPLKGEFTTRQMADYGTVRLNITDIPYDSLGPLPVVVELLDNQDKPVKTAGALPGQGASFTHLLPGAYYARAFIDLNGNGIWDTGNLGASHPAEEVFYYPKKLNVRKNWDISQDWAMFELPVDLQKPYDIKKNKPKTKDAPQRGTDDEEEEDPNDPFGSQGSWGNGSQYNNAHRFSGGAGMQTVKKTQ